MSSDDSAIVSWTWTITQDDGTVVGTRTGMTNTTTLPPGRYKVTLTAVDDAGNEGSDYITVLVIGADAPVADAGQDATVEAGDQLVFDASGTTSVNGIEEYEWAFLYDDQDVVLEGVKPSFTFSVPGSYVVGLTVIDSKGYPGTDAVTITVVDTTPPTAVIDVRQREDDGWRVLDGNGSTDVVGVTNWTWKVVFENEITHLHGPVVDLHRNDPGRYEVTLTVRDAAGNEDAASSSFTIGEGGKEGGSNLLIILAVVILAAVGGTITWYVKYR
jgi:PKD repeat protein